MTPEFNQTSHPSPGIRRHRVAAERSFKSGAPFHESSHSPSLGSLWTEQSHRCHWRKRRRGENEIRKIC